jgi:hypothetical protein
MNCVDLMLKPRQKPGDWEILKTKKFICVRCESIIKGESPELYYFPQVDFVFHLHEHVQKDEIYYRSFWIRDDGTIHIVQADPKMNFIALYGIALDGKGNYKSTLEFDENVACSTKFFQSMQRYNRKLDQSSSIGMRSA